MNKYKRELMLLAVLFISLFVFAEEKRAKVVVMDTGIDINKKTIPYLCSEGHIDFTNTGLEDRIGHGTNVAGLIAKGMNKTRQCIIVLKYYNTEKDPFNGQNVGEILDKAWDYLLYLNPEYVNMSFNGELYVHKEFKTIRKLLDQGSIITVAAGNEALDLSKDCKSYPACYKFKDKGFYVVSSTDGTFGNYNGPVNSYEWGINQVGLFGPMMTGTSQACANKMAKILEGKK